MNKLSLSSLGAANPGWAGIAGLALFACMAAFYFSALRPEETRLEQLREESLHQRQRSEPAAAEAPKAPAEKLAAFYAYFPRPDHLPDLLEKIFGAAQRQSLVLDQGEYRPVKEPVGELMRYQVVLPVQGTYPQIRKFVDGALADVPSLSLEGIQFERQKVGDAAVAAKVRFVVYLENRS